MMLLVVGCANENKKENVSKDNNSPKETVTDTNKKDDTTDTNKEEKTDTNKEENADTKKEENGTNTQSTNEVVDNTQTSSPAPAPTPTCTPKKFNGTYSYAYSTMEECKREGNNLFMDIKILFMTVLKVVKRDGINQEGHVTMEKFNGNN